MTRLMIGVRNEQGTPGVEAEAPGARRVEEGVGAIT